jgi:hypothetical protein
MIVVSEKLDGNGLLGLLKKADKTFECVRENGYRAANAGLPTREPLKKPRDLDQAKAVAQLVRDQMPQLSFESTLTSLHGDV